MTVRSKDNYDRNPDSGTKSTARSKVNYDRDPDSGAKLTARSKANYNRDPESGTKLIPCSGVTKFSVAGPPKRLPMDIL